MDSFADSVMGTLRKIKTSIIPDDESEEPKDQPDGAAEEEAEHHKKKNHSDANHGHHEGKKSKGLQPNNPHSNTPGQRRITHTYEPSNQGKDGTLLAIARHKPEGPNSETGKRTRSMRLAHSMNSVYRKIRNDKNIHNDRHYLVAVTEHLKEEGGAAPQAAQHSGRHK